MRYASGANSNSSRNLRRSRSSSLLVAASASLRALSSSSARRSSSNADIRSSRSSRLTGASATSVVPSCFRGLLPASRAWRENSRRSSAGGCGPGSIILRRGGVTSGLSLPETCGCNYGAEHLKFPPAIHFGPGIPNRSERRPDSVPNLGPKKNEEARRDPCLIRFRPASSVSCCCCSLRSTGDRRGMLHHPFFPRFWPLRS